MITSLTFHRPKSITVKRKECTTEASGTSKWYEITICDDPEKDRFMMSVFFDDPIPALEAACDVQP